MIRDLVRSADGDFIILVLNPDANKLLVFNDYTGRLPVYYYNNPDVFILGREIKFLLNVIPNGLSLNKLSIVETCCLNTPWEIRLSFTMSFDWNHLKG